MLVNVPLVYISFIFSDTPLFWDRLRYAISSTPNKITQSIQKTQNFKNSKRHCEILHNFEERSSARIEHEHEHEHEQFQATMDKESRSKAEPQT